MGLCLPPQLAAKLLRYRLTSGHESFAIASTVLVEVNSVSAASLLQREELNTKRYIPRKKKTKNKRTLRTYRNYFKFVASNRNGERLSDRQKPTRNNKRPETRKAHYKSKVDIPSHRKVSLYHALTVFRSFSHEQQLYPRLKANPQRLP